MFRVISFYKYVGIDDPASIVRTFRQACRERGIFGRILVSTEGINGAVCGTEQDIIEFKTVVHAHSLFADVTFREQASPTQSYHKLVARVRKEIVAFGAPVNVSEQGRYLEPEEFNRMIERDDVVVLDTRNDYETAVGKFKGAITLPIETFRDFPRAVQQLNHLRKKKVVMYCTGGVRCEKASAYLKQQGFEEVYQLHGGIIHYLNAIKDSHFEGSCFMFDDRLGVLDDRSEPITSCTLCGEKTSTYTNCYNLDCDRLFLCCESCNRSMTGTCSNACRRAPRQRKGVANKAAV